MNGHKGFFLSAYLGSALSVAVAALVAAAVSQVVTVPHVTVLLLASVFYTATRWGLGPSLFAAVCSVAVSSFFFMPPIYSFYVAEAQDIVDLIVFFVAAVVTSKLASRATAQAIEGARREARIRDLATFSRSLTGLLDADGVLRATVMHCTMLFQRRVALLLPHDGGLVQFGAESGRGPLSDAAMEHAREIWSDSKVQGASASDGWEFLRLDGKVGLVAIESSAALEHGERENMQSVLSSFAVIIERAASTRKEASRAAMKH